MVSESPGGATYIIWPAHFRRTTHLRRPLGYWVGLSGGWTLWQLVREVDGLVTWSSFSSCLGFLLSFGGLVANSYSFLLFNFIVRYLIHYDNYHNTGINHAKSTIPTQLVAITDSTAVDPSTPAAFEIPPCLPIYDQVVQPVSLDPLVSGASPHLCFRSVEFHYHPHPRPIPLSVSSSPQCPQVHLCPWWCWPAVEQRNQTLCQLSWGPVCSRQIFFWGNKMRKLGGMI